MQLTGFNLHFALLWYLALVQLWSQGAVLAGIQQG
jgi:hypothetical protein